MPRAKKPAASPEAKPIVSYNYPESGRANLPTADSADILIPPSPPSSGACGVQMHTCGTIYTLVQHGV